MAALMTTLIGAALAALGGRWWTLGAGLVRDRARAALPLVLLSAIAAAGVAASGGAWIGAQVRGPGMLLFLALALLFAGAGALWPVRAAMDADARAARAPVSAFILLLAAQLSESAPFLILAVAAWTREPVWSAIGGASGMMAAVMAAPLLPARSPVLRAGISALLLTIGAVLAVGALGLV